MRRISGLVYGGVLISVVSFSGASEAPGLSSEELLARSFRTFAESSGWSSTVVWTMTSARTDIPMKFEGRVLGKGALFRAEMKMRLLGTEIERKVVVDHHGVAWCERKSGEQVEITKAGVEASIEKFRVREPIGSVFHPGPLGGRASHLKDLTSSYVVEQKGLARVGETEVVVLEARLRDEVKKALPEGTARIERLVLSLGAKDAVPRRFVSEASNGDSYAVDFLDLKVDVEVDDGRFTYAPSPGAAVTDLADGAPRKSDSLVSTYFRRVKNPIAYSARSVAQGRGVYTADCLICHGDSYDGTGGDIPSTDLTDPGEWLYGTSAGEMFVSIRDGAGIDMPPHKRIYKSDESLIWHLVNFIESVQPRPAASRPDDEG